MAAASFAVSEEEKNAFTIFQRDQSNLCLCINNIACPFIARKKSSRNWIRLKKCSNKQLSERSKIYRTIRPLFHRLNFRVKNKIHFEWNMISECWVLKLWLCALSSRFGMRPRLNGGKQRQNDWLMLVTWSEASFDAFRLFVACLFLFRLQFGRFDFWFLPLKKCMFFYFFLTHRSTNACKGILQCIWERKQCRRYCQRNCMRRSVVWESKTKRL